MYNNNVNNEGERRPRPRFRREGTEVKIGDGQLHLPVLPLGGQFHPGRGDRTRVRDFRLAGIAVQPGAQRPFAPRLKSNGDRISFSRPDRTQGVDHGLLLAIRFQKENVFPVRTGLHARPDLLQGLACGEIRIPENCLPAIIALEISSRRIWRNDNVHIARQAGEVLLTDAHAVRANVDGDNRAFAAREPVFDNVPVFHL